MGADRDAAIVPVLLYHRVSRDMPADAFAVTPERLAEHVDAIVASGRTPVTMTELAEGLRGRARLPERPVAVTFDDGFQDTPAAIDRLRQAGLPCTVYVTTGTIGHEDGITAGQVALLARRPGVELGAHTVSHPRLDELSEREARMEIGDSKRALEELTGGPIETFAYPHGAYDACCRRLVIEAGFRCAAAVKNALSHSADDPWAIARWTVMSDTSTAQVAALLDGRSAPMAWERERVRTRAYRHVRRARRRLRAARPGWPGPQTAVRSPLR